MVCLSGCCGGDSKRRNINKFLSHHKGVYMLGEGQTRMRAVREFSTALMRTVKREWESVILDNKHVELSSTLNNVFESTRVSMEYMAVKVELWLTFISSFDPALQKSILTNLAVSGRWLPCRYPF